MSVIDLKARLLEAEAERDYLGSLVASFMTGEVPRKASLQHFILAQWGRKRLDEQRAMPALLRGNEGS